jgi:hypothetical protein
MSSERRGDSKVIIPVSDYPFKGPHRTVGNLVDRPGAFAVFSEFNGKYYLLDVDFSDEVKKAIENHERIKCWEKYRKGLIRYAVLYESDFPSKPKEEIVKEVRKRYVTMPCGGGPR